MRAHSSVLRFWLTAALLLLLVGCFAAGASAENAAGQNDTQQTATVIPVNQPYSDSIITDGDVDFYRVSLPADGMISVSLSHPLIDSDAYFWTLRLYAEDMTDIGSTYFVGRATSGATPQIGVPAGTYYVKLTKCDTYPRSHSSEMYSLCVNYTASDYWEKESNPDYKTASDIVLNETYQGAIVVDGDVDYYRFVTAEDGVFQFEFSHEIIDSTEYYWTVQLYNGNLDHLGSRYFTGKITSDKMPEIGLPAGTYYLRITKSDTYPRYHTNATYTFRGRFTASDAWEKEPNGSYQTASALFTNKKYSGSVALDSDQDFYRFTTDKPGYVRFHFSHDIIDSTEYYWTIYLYDGDYNYLTSRYIGGKEKEADSCEIGIPAGTYYLKILKSDTYPRYHTDQTYHFTMTYSASALWEREQNNSFQTANPAALNTGVSGAIAYDGDEDYFAFSLSRTETVQLSLKHPLIDSTDIFWTVVLFDDGLNALSTFHIGGKTPDYLSEAFTLQAGSYYMKIRKSDTYPRRHSGDTYTLCVTNGEAPTVMAGDVDGDGVLTPADARLALRASVGLESFAPGSRQFLAADADHNGTLTPADARLILRASVGLETLR